MESKKTFDEQTSGLGEQSSSHSNPSTSSGTLCRNCKTKITANDYMNHILTCPAHTGEMDFQTTLGKYLFFAFNAI